MYVRTAVRTFDRTAHLPILLPPLALPTAAREA